MKRKEKKKEKKCSGRESIPDPLARKTTPLPVEPPDPTHKDRDTFRYWCYQQGPRVWLGSRDRSLLVTNGVFLFRDFFSLPVVRWSRGLPFGRGRCKSTQKKQPKRTLTPTVKMEDRWARGTGFDSRGGQVWFLLFPVSLTLPLVSEVRRVVFGTLFRDLTRKTIKTNPMRKIQDGGFTFV